MSTNGNSIKRRHARDEDFVGKKFGLLTVIERCSEELKNNRPHVYFLCQCDCGSRHVARASHLRTGYTMSCGCLKRGRPLGSGKKYDYNGQSMTIREWSESLGINLSTLTSRIANGWSVERLLGSTPKRRSQ